MRAPAVTRRSTRQKRPIATLQPSVDERHNGIQAAEKASPPAEGRTAPPAKPAATSR
ncbi:hypothetical protein UUU_06390 [Klebsiella pneumoniae subsp. pneumoniae DSM 30104 = JCM 1662 = NBRC 14940]|nr:hypothetical protein UUU_06390 [Klebsiella pneumoniae subsp. pneumoniae DSM 30104 = JCM 1662 = NBRC 14940]